MDETRFEPSEHPSRDQLDAFGRGEIAEELAREIERHLESCGTCLLGLEVVDETDAWLEMVREAGRGFGAREGDDRPALESKYELEGLIGRGGMGVVHRARQVGLGRRVALKRIAAGRDASPMLVDRFRREVEAVARLNHPAIVPIFDVGVRDGVPFYAMELLEGGSLSDRLAGGPMRVAEAVALIERLARGIEHAHEQGVVHRDLKPSNILFDAEGQAKVADFGLAKRLDAEPGGEATRSGLLLGTPGYMAPEQAGGPGTVGPAADIHALGAILFECLTGRPPFLAPGPMETLDLIRTSEPPSPSRLRPGLPGDLGTICLTCLEKEPGRRYATAGALADDLARFGRGEPIRARPSGVMVRAVKWAKRRPAEAGFVGLLAVAVAGTIAGLLVHQSRLREALGREAAAAADARKQRGAAEENYRAARGALSKIMTALSGSKYLLKPGLAELHREQAEAALEFYDRALAAADSADPIVRRDTAGAAVEAANLQIVLGRVEPAEANLLRADRLYRGLSAESPDDRTLLRDRMVARIKLGVLKMGVDTKRSVEALSEALELTKRLGNEHDPHDVAWCEHNLGSTWVLGGDPARALPHFERAIELYEQSPLLKAGDSGLKVELAQSLVNAGLARANLARNEAAEADFRRACALLDEAITAMPETGEFVASRCDLMVNWGNLEATTGRVDQAIARLTDGVDAIEPLVAAGPGVTRLRTTAINLHGARAQALERAGRYREAAKDWDRLVELEGEMPEAFLFRLQRFLCRARAGEVPAALAEAEELAARPGLTGADCYNLACGLSVASAFCSEGPERDRSKERAMALLGKALEMSPELRETARGDADLDSLRGEEGFRRFMSGT